MTTPLTQRHLVDYLDAVKRLDANMREFGIPVAVPLIGVAASLMEIIARMNPLIAIMSVDWLNLANEYAPGRPAIDDAIRRTIELAQRTNTPPAPGVPDAQEALGFEVWINGTTWDPAYLVCHSCGHEFLRKTSQNEPVQLIDGGELAGLLINHVESCGQ